VPTDGTVDGVPADGTSPDGTGSDAARRVPDVTMAPEETAVPGKGRKTRGRRDADGDAPGRRSGPSRALVRVLAVLLVLLIAGTAFLWFTRPAPSAVHTADYVGALQAAKAGVVDFASFDYLTLDDDIEQIKRVTTEGDLRDEAVDRLDADRQTITTAQTVVNTKVVTAGVVKADDSTATVLMQLQTTEESAAGNTQAQLRKYRIQVQLEKVGGRWLLSGISGR
jgi:Mce-associated membrane protein